MKYYGKMTKRVEQAGSRCKSFLKTEYLESDLITILIGTRTFSYKTQLTGLPSGTVSVVKTTDIAGNDTVSTTTLDRANKTVIQTVNTPESSTDSETVKVNGLVTSQITSANLEYTYSYDGLGRQTGVTDPRTGQSTTAYYTSGAGKKGKVQSVTDAASNTTTFDYSTSTGRKISEENALGKKTYFDYNSRGQISKTWGDVPYPTEYSYDSYGRMSTLNTYRGTSADFTQSTWPSSPGTADTTTWTYQEATGLLTAKTYADAKSVSYTYTADGKLATRTWSRLNGSNPLVTSYSYTVNGELATVNYSDATPSTTFTYNRLGQETSVSDALGNRTFSYNNHLQLSTEEIDGLYDRTITHGYDSIGRNNALSLDSGYSLSYSYDSYGRHNGLAMNNQTITHGFTANSDLIGSITRTNGINTAISYESNRNAITQIQHANTNNLATYVFTNDSLARRTSMSKSGSAFSQSDTIDYGYNDRSEVVSAESQNISAYDYEHSFDPIGNRITSRIEAVTRSYTTNNLNQYSAITNPTASPTYDFDGNMTSMPLGATQWTAAWDCENRLISLEKSDMRLEFKYDYMSRRVEKKVFTGSTGNWTLVTHNLFVYNGYRQIERISVDGETQTILQRFAWSLDDQLRLIADLSSSTTYSVHHDANRNVTELTAPNGSIAAHYEYAPFGALTVSTGSYASSNPFRFSSEYFDPETGLVYYNYRYFSPELGRWISRDPIEEEGGFNLFVAMLNNPVNLLDDQGLITWWECSGYCASYHLKQMLNAILAIEALAAAAEGIMEVPANVKKINMGIENMTSIGNKIFQKITTVTNSSKNMPSIVKQTLQQVGNWAKTSGSMKNIPGLRSKIDAVRRFAKSGRTLARMMRGGAVAGASIALAIEAYCMTSCCREDVRAEYENLMNTSPEDFL